MGLKKNILYSGFLTTALYLSQLITYPYVARTLGATNLGYCNFVNSFVQLFSLFSSLGISVLGVREIAKANGDKASLNKCFSCIFILHAFTTVISLLCYIIAILSFSELKCYQPLLWIGTFNIIFGLFNIEWLYRGLENFKYITHRTLLIRIFYIALVFLLVKENNHFVRYFSLSVLAVITNSVINWIHGRKYVSLVGLSIRQMFIYWKPFLLIGLQMMLLSYNSTINPILLGLMSNNTEVGYFTIASKLTLIFLLLYNSYTLVLLPRICSMAGKLQEDKSQVLIKRSYSLLYLIGVPLVYLAEIYVPEIIYLFGGSGYEGAIIPMRLSLPIILIGGISQITINQYLIPNNLEKGTVIAAMLGVLICLILNFLLIPIIKSSATAISWVIAEACITIFSLKYAKQKVGKSFSVEFLSFLKYIILFLPLCAISFIKEANFHFFIQLAISVFLAITYSHIILWYIMKDKNYKFLLKKMIK